MVASPGRSDIACPCMLLRIMRKKIQIYIVSFFVPVFMFFEKIFMLIVSNRLMTLKALILRGMFFFPGVLFASAVTIKTLDLFSNASVSFINRSRDDLPQ